MSSSQEGVGVWVSAYSYLANTWPHHDSKDLTTYLSGPVDSYHVQDYGLSPVDDLTPDDVPSSEYMPDYSPVTPGSETFYFAGFDMPLYSPTGPGSDTVMFAPSNPSNLTWVNAAPRPNLNSAVQAASVLKPASSAEIATTSTTSPASVAGARPQPPSKKPTQSAVALKKPRHAPHPHPLTSVATTTMINFEQDTLLQLKNPPKRKPQQRKQQQQNLKQHHKGRTSNISALRESPRQMQSPTISSEDDIDDTILRKKAHNLVEKRYRANLNSRFAALEQAILSKTVSTTAEARVALKNRTTRTAKTSSQNDGEMILSTTTTTSTRAKGPSKKAAILKNALAYIEELQSENRALRSKLEFLRAHDLRNAGADSNSTAMSRCTGKGGGRGGGGSKDV